MTHNDEVQQRKQRLSPLLMAIPGVSGVGTRGGVLTVYLAEDSELVREAVNTVVGREAPGTQVSFVATGPFRAY
jgi:hypothetical protein